MAISTEQSMHQLSFLRARGEWMWERVRRGAGVGTDAVILCGGWSLRVHREMAWEMARFRGELVETVGTCFLRVDERVVSERALKEALRFCYVGEANVRVSNLDECMRAADWLGMENFMKACCLGGMRHMSADSCVYVSHVAREYGDYPCARDLVAEADKVTGYLRRMDPDEYVGVDISHMKDIIAICTESGLRHRYIVSMALHWMAYNPYPRCVHWDDLMEATRAHIIPSVALGEMFCDFPELMQARMNQPQ